MCRYYEFRQNRSSSPAALGHNSEKIIVKMCFVKITKRISMRTRRSKRKIKIGKSFDNYCNNERT